MAISEVEWLDIFSGNLRDLLKEARMSQQELAEDTGIAKSTISKYVNGTQVPSVFTIIKLAYSLNCSVEDLMDFGDVVRQKGV